jgi:hypothetical protein
MGQPIPRRGLGQGRRQRREPVVERTSRRRSVAPILAAMQRVRVWWMLCLAVPLLAPPAFGRAGIDTRRALQHRLGADACIIDAVIIYTDPYIGGRLTHDQVVANIARMCERPFALYGEDLRLDPATARRRLRQTIEAGLRGQLRAERGAGSVGIDGAQPAGR